MDGSELWAKELDVIRGRGEPWGIFEWIAGVSRVCWRVRSFENSGMSEKSSLHGDGGNDHTKGLKMRLPVVVRIWL